MAETIHFEEAAQRKAQRERKRRMRRVLYGVWLMLFAVFVYVVIQVVLVLTPNIRTEVAILETMTDSITARGFVALESQPVESNGGVLYFTLDSGERVSAGTTIAEVFSTQAAVEARGKLDELDAEIDRLQIAMNTSSVSGDTETYINQLQGHLSSVRDAIDTGDYTAVKEPAGEAELAANKLQIATNGGDMESYTYRYQSLLNERASYESRAAVQDVLLAPTTGYFVQASGKDRIPVDYETLSAAGAQQLQSMVEQAPQYYPSNVAGYIINDYKWNFFALVDAADIARFTVGSKTLSISFAEIGTNRLPVMVQSVAHEAGEEYAVVELYCEYMSPEILKMQNQTVEIIFSEQKGVRISNDALRVYKGQEGVFVVFGGLVSFRRVEILLQDDFYFLVPANTNFTDSAVELYDEIIIDSGGTELYEGKIL